MLDPGAGKTKRACIWAYAQDELNAQCGMFYEFCLGRAAQCPVAFMGAVQGPPGPSPGLQLEGPPARQATLVGGHCAECDAVLDKCVYSQRIAAHCLAHPRRKFDELQGASEVAKTAIQRIDWSLHAEGQFDGMNAQQRLTANKRKRLATAS